MINTLRLCVVILFTLLLNACVMGGQMGGQMAAQNTYALQAAGPVGRVALNTSGGGRGNLYVPGAGDSVYAGSGFDARTHAVAYQRYLMDRPMIMTSGGRPPVIMVPDSGEAVGNTNGTASASSAGGNPGESASAGRVDRIARTVSRLSVRQEEQGRVLQRIDQRLRRQPPPATTAQPTASSAPAPGTPPAYVIDQWMVEVPR